MNDTRIIIKSYEREQDVPNPGAGNTLLKIKRKRLIFRPNEEKKLVDRWDTVEVPADIIPTVEREYLADVNDILRVSPYLFRPIKQLTREECNTYNGRLALLSWQTFGTYHSNNETFYLVFDAWKDITSEEVDLNKLFAIPTNCIEKYCGLWTPFGDRMLDVNSCLSSDNIDIVCGKMLGEELTTRDAFVENVINAPFGFEDVPPDVLRKYDYIQYSVDCLFATYELFRTEQYDNIASFPVQVQRVAVHNYFARYLYFSDRGRGTLKYNKPKYVVANVAKLMNIPPEVWKWAKNPTTPDPLAAPKKTDTTQAADKPTGILSKEPQRQRTDYGGQLKLYFGEYDGKKIKDADGNVVVGVNNAPVVITDELLQKMVFDDTARYKLFKNIEYAVATSADIDTVEFAKKVAMVKTKKDVAALFKEFSCTIDAAPIIKSVYGFISPTNCAAFRVFIETLPDELFVFLHNVVTQKKDGTETVVHLRSWEKKNVKTWDAENEKYDIVGTQEKRLLFSGRRYNWLGWLNEQTTTTREDGKKTRKSDFDCLIQVNPIHFANMIDANGNLTNFEEYTPEYMAYIDELKPERDKVTPALEKILRREYNKAFFTTNSAVRSKIKQATEEGKPKPKKEELAAIRRNKLTVVFDNKKLFDAILSQIDGRKFEDMTAKQRSDLKKQTDRAFDTLIRHEVLISGYKSISKDKTAVTFNKKY